MSARPTATLTEAQVIEVLGRLDAGEYQHVIANDYGVSTKTISRIKTGETWSEVTQRFRSKHPLANITHPIVKIAPMAAETIDVMDEAIAVKNHFGFDFNQPLHWGWFDGWDGLHAVVSDGIILWESTDLLNYAQRLATSGIDAHPIWANRAEEMPTFDLEDILTLPVGEKFDIEMETGGLVRLSQDDHQVFLHQRFINIARKMKLDIRVAGEQEQFVYLTRLKPKSPSDPMHVVIACVATMDD
jgi:hypothetical protein